jgi:hypothetical protein
MGPRPPAMVKDLLVDGRPNVLRLNPFERGPAPGPSATQARHLHGGRDNVVQA